MNAFDLERLPFRLHDFTRSTWVSERAQAIWQPRIDRVAACWLQLELLSVVTGLRRCTHTIISAKNLEALTTKMSDQGLVVEIMESLGNFHSTYAATTSTDKPINEPANYSIVIGTPDDAALFREAWTQRNQTNLGLLLGYPTCCTAFFDKVWYGERLIDVTWPMAYNTIGDTQDVSHEHVCVIDELPHANVMLRWLGIRAVPHLPCRFDCRETINHAEQFIALGRNAGYIEEMDWLVEMLSWPIQWSALHGIAEIKTPVVKIATTTDATPFKYSVRYEGTIYPEEGADGLAFPYMIPQHLKMTESNSFQRGLSNPIHLYDHVVSPKTDESDA